LRSKKPEMNCNTNSGGGRNKKGDMRTWSAETQGRFCQGIRIPGMPGELCGRILSVQEEVDNVKSEGARSPKPKERLSG
jgi:hypothetical protein